MIKHLFSQKLSEYSKNDGKMPKTYKSHRKRLPLGKYGTISTSK